MNKENIELTLKSDATSTDSKKDGTKLVGKFGPYWLCKADTVEEGMISWFGKKASDLKAGAKIIGSLEIKTSEKDGKTYTNKNFTFPKANAGVDPEEFRKLTNRVTSLEMSEARREEEFKKFLLNLKSEVFLEQTGKFQSTADYKNYISPHPMVKEPEIDGVPLEIYENDF